jgi:hypothetical protein
MNGLSWTANRLQLKSLPDNEQTVVEWSLSDNEQTTVFVDRETPYNYKLYSWSERDLCIIVCSLSERDHSTTVYVHCPRETISLQSMFVVQLNGLSQTSNID